MKCDELKPLVFSLNELSFIDESAVQKDFENPHDHAVYNATEVDAAIAELKAENERLKKCEIWMIQHFYCEEVIACESAKNRKLKRALWLARADRARSEIEYWKYINRYFNGYRYNINHVRNVYEKRTPLDWICVWNCVERKCRAKAEEYL